MRRYIVHPLLVFLGFVAISTTSCIGTKQVKYFNNLPDSAKIELATLQPPAQIIQVNDILEIRLGGENEKTIGYLNQYLPGGNGLSTGVDINGNIELPKIGKLKVAGLSREAAKNTIVQAYSEYLLNPIVEVKFGTFRFSALGEVASPGEFEIASEKLSILEALAKAGDLTVYAEREEIKIIRDVNGKREVLSINLNDKAILNSPNFYLNRYDIIYAPPKNVKAITDNVQRTATYIATVSSLLALFIVIFKN